MLPNKLFEYSATGKPSVMTNFNPHLDEFSNFVSITSNKDKFLNEINNLDLLNKSIDLIKASKKEVKLFKNVIKTLEELMHGNS